MGVLIRRALLFGVYVGGPGFWKLALQTMEFCSYLPYSKPAVNEPKAQDPFKGALNHYMEVLKNLGPYIWEGLL